MASVRTLVAPADLLALREDWECLTARAAFTNIFLTWDWMTVWCKHYVGRAQPRVVAVYEGSDLIALAPFMIREYRVLGLPLFRRIAFLGTGVSDRLDVLLAPGRERAGLDAIVSHLRSFPWDVADLDEVPEDSATARLLPALAASPDLGVEVTPQSTCPVVKLLGDPESQLASLGRKTRSNLMYYQRRLARTHRIAVQVLRDGQDLAEGLGTFLALYQRCFADRAASALTGEKFAAFRRDIAMRCAPQGRLLLVLLRVDDEHVAGELGFLYRRTWYVYNKCHDPAWRSEHVGTILQWEAIRHAILAGCHEYDFLRGDEGYKAHWGGKPRRQVRIRLMRASPKVRMARAAAPLLRSLSGARLAKRVRPREGT